MSPVLSEVALAEGSSVRTTPTTQCMFIFKHEEMTVKASKLLSVSAQTQLRQPSGNVSLAWWAGASCGGCGAAGALQTLTSASSPPLTTFVIFCRPSPPAGMHKFRMPFLTPPRYPRLQNIACHSLCQIVSLCLLGEVICARCTGAAV